MSKELMELAERVEKATGPDRRLNTQIEIATSPDRRWIIGNEPGRFPQAPIYGTLSDLWEWATDESKDPPEIGAGDYTASIDAAMSLDTPELKKFGGPLAMLREAMDRLFLAKAGDDALPRFLSAAFLRSRATLLPKEGV